MLSASQLTKLAYKFGKISETSTSQNRIDEALLAQTICAIYTVGAELIGRLDNMHFTADSYADRDGQMMSIAVTEGYIHPLGRNNDNRSEDKDISASQEGAPTPGSPEGQRREGVEGS